MRTYELVYHGQVTLTSTDSRYLLSIATNYRNAGDVDIYVQKQH